MITHSQTAPSVGSFVASERQRLRLSQSRLAVLANVDHSLISRIESGERKPSRDVVGWLASALDLDGMKRAQLYLSCGYATVDDLQAMHTTIAEVVRLIDIADESVAAARAAMHRLMEEIAS